ncbi:TonB-dependent receptor [Chitinophaga oryziterrae]
MVNNSNSDTTITLKGKVVNEKGEPIIGATVLIKGSTMGTTTLENGDFSLNSVRRNAALTVSSIGFVTQDVSFGSGRTKVIQLKNYVGALDETVIIAYGTTTRRFSTGNVTTVKAEEIEKQPVSNPLLSLQGRVAGMLITQQTGVPGGAIQVQIRGRSSINPAVGNDPLYIIDGVPYSSQSLSKLGLGITGNGNPLNLINPLDILSIDILKDADATAIYGSRGSNGVVLITTKKGQIGASKVEFSGYFGTGNVTRSPNLLNTNQYLEMRHEAFLNDHMTPDPTFDQDINGIWDTTRYTNWPKKVIQGNAQYTDSRISLSGGNANTQYLIDGSYHKETTTFSKDFFDKKNAIHFNINSVSQNQKFKITLSGIYLIDNNNLTAGDVTDRILLPPDAPAIFNSDATLNWANNTWDNPQARFYNKYKTFTTNLVSNSVLSYNFIPNLDVKVNLGYTNTQTNETLTNAIASYRPSYGITTGSSQFTNNYGYTWITEPQITYNLRLGSGKINALIGNTIQKLVSNQQVIQGNGYTNDALLYSLAAAANVSKGDVNYIQYKYNAIYGRLTYNLKDRYLLNLTARRDGSSRFGPGKQFGNFGSIATGWIFSNENFSKKNLPMLSFGKIRASYGTTGNDQISDYQYLGLYEFTNGGIPYQGGQGLFPSYLPASDYSWEKNVKTEGAIELGFIKDRILLTVNYYHNYSSNQLVNYRLPDIAGFQSITANLPATVQNSGWEFTLNTTNIKTQKFSWISSGNLTIANNKLVKFANLKNSSYKDIYEIGKSIQVVKVYHLTGVDSETGVYKFSDKNGKETFNPDYENDRTTFINTAPKFYGGFQNTIQYKGLQLDFLIQFVKQIGHNYLYSTQFPGRFYFNQPKEILHRWKKSGDISSIQKFTQNSGSDAARAYDFAGFSDYAYTDASFIRLKNFSISYSLHEIFKKSMHLQNARVYVQGQNFLTITRYKGVDPENQSISALPPLKVLTAGIHLEL